MSEHQEVNEPQRVGFADPVDLLDDVVHRPLPNVLLDRGAVHLVAPCVVEAVGAAVGASPLGDEDLALDLPVALPVVVDDAAVRKAQLLQVVHQGTDAVPVDLPVLLHPEILDLGYVLALLEPGAELRHGVFALAPADRIHPLLLDHLRHEGGMAVPEDGKSARQLLELPVELQVVDVIPRRHGVGKDLGIEFLDFFKPVLFRQELGADLVPRFFQPGGEIHDADHLGGKIFLYEKDPHSIQPDG